MSTSPAPIRRGDRIGDRYIVGDLLGAGGMGLVYSARQSPLERMVAIKFPRPELAANPAVQREFRREAVLAALVEHPNIVRVFDFLSAAPSYLVMEYAVGQRLGQLLADRGPLPVSTAAELVTQILRALREIHRRRIVHRDVKCDNVLVETLRDGTHRARLFDFGLARYERDFTPMTDGVLCGTPEYLSPEVIGGAPPRIAADIYAAGTILYELIVGETPYGGGTAADVLARHLDHPLVPMSWRCPDLGVPRELDDVLEHALAKDPAARYPDCGVFLDALAEAVAVTPARPRTHSVGTAFPSDARTIEMIVPTPTPIRASLVPDEPPHTSERGSDPDVDHAIVGYLERARGLIDKHELGAAIIELEAAERVLGDTEPLWRIDLTLAGLYEGVDDHERARAAGIRACDRARMYGSQLGCARAKRYLAQLAGRMRSRRYRSVL